MDALRIIAAKIRDYRCFNNQIFNFDDNYKLIDDQLIEVTSNNSVFYRSIKSITGIIGKNGYGKSTLIEFIKSVINDNESVIGSYLILKYKDDIFYVGDNCNVIFRNNPIPSLKSSPYSLKDIFKSIFLYSPVYNPHAASEKKTKISDYSNDFLYSYAREKNKELDLKLHFEYLVFQSELNSNSSREAFLEINLTPVPIQKLFSFLISSNRDFLDSKTEYSKYRDMVEYYGADIFLRLQQEEIKLKSDSNKIFDGSISVELDSVVNDLNHSQRYLVFEDYVQINFLAKALLKRITGIKKGSRLNSSESFFEVAEDILLLYRYKDLQSWLHSDLNIKNHSDSFDSSYIEEVDKFLEFSSITSSSIWPIRFTPNQTEVAMSFIRNIRKHGYLKYGFEIGWVGVSSGQLAKLNFFSRLVHTLEKVDSSDFTIILDEADIYLHPEWQRTFLFDLERFIADYSWLRRNITINVILTTHSPLMVSDIKRGDVYLLRNPGEAEIITAHTFGANLFDLYKDEFVISSPRGELANSTIREISSSIIDKKIDSQSIRVVIDEIGDKILKVGLGNLLDQHAKS